VPVTRSWWREISAPARVTFAGAIPVAFGAVGLEAVLNDSLGPEHPLGVARLALRLVPFVATAACFAIAATGALRARRVASRLRGGLCPACGYDLRGTTGRCPECGAPSPAQPAA